MNRKINILLFTIFFLCLGSNYIYSQNDIKLCNKIKSLSISKFDHFISKDSFAIASILHDSLTYIHSNGWIENKNEVIGNILSNKLSYNQVNITDSLLCHVVDSNVVIVRGSGLFDVSLEDNGIQIKLLYTEIYSKDNEKWCLIHRHACKIN